MGSKLSIIRGDTIKGTATLRTLSPNDSTKMDNYVIPGGSSLTMYLKGEASVVSITSGASEITIIDASRGQIAFVLSAAKSALLKKGTDLAVDVVVNDAGEITTFEKLKTVDVKDRENT